MSLANLNLSIVQPILEEMLPDGRMRITVRWKVGSYKLSSTKIKTLAFDSTLGVLMSASYGGNTAPVYTTYPTAVLTKQEVRMPHLRAGEPEPSPNFPVLEKIYEEAATTPTQYAPDQPITGPDNIEELEVEFIMQTNSTYTPSSQGGVVGTSTHNSGILKSEKIEVDLAIRRIKRTYVVSGIIQAKRVQKNNQGIMVVQFHSIGTKLIPTALNGTMSGTNAYTGHIGGSTSVIIIQDDIREINGLQTFETSIVLKQDGTVLAQTGSTTTVSYDDYIKFNIPGTVNLDPNGDGSILYALFPPTPNYPLKVLITQGITDSSDVGTAPWYMKLFAYASGAWTTPDGAAHSFQKGLVNFLSGTGWSAGTTVLGQTCTNVDFLNTSSPTKAQFDTDFVAGKVLETHLTLAFVDAYGKQYYRFKKVAIAVFPTPITY